MTACDLRLVRRRMLIFQFEADNSGSKPKPGETLESEECHILIAIPFRLELDQDWNTSVKVGQSFDIHYSVC